MYVVKFSYCTYLVHSDDPYTAALNNPLDIDHCACFISIDTRRPAIPKLRRLQATASFLRSRSVQIIYCCIQTPPQTGSHKHVIRLHPRWRRDSATFPVTWLGMKGPRAWFKRLPIPLLAHPLARFAWLTSTHPRDSKTDSCCCE